MKHIYLLIDSRESSKGLFPVTEVSNRIYKKAKELLSLNKYDFHETTEDDSGTRIHRVKPNEPMPYPLSQFILENL